MRPCRICCCTSAAWANAPSSDDLPAAGMPNRTMRNPIDLTGDGCGWVAGTSDMALAPGDQSGGVFVRLEDMYFQPCIHSHFFERLHLLFGFVGAVFVDDNVHELERR